MGGGETDKSRVKEPKTPPTSAPNTTQSTTAGSHTGQPEWAGFQAYPPMPPPGFMASSPQAHPYMWGVQQIMPHYGTPPHPYVAIYPHGGMYPHPSVAPGSYPFSPFAMPSSNGIPEVPGKTTSSMEGDGRPSDVKEKLPIKRSQGNLVSSNTTTGKNSEHGKTSGPSANGAYTKSAGSSSDGMSEESDSNSDDGSPSQLDSGGRHDMKKAGASQDGESALASQYRGSSMPHMLTHPPIAIMSNSTAGVPVPISSPATNLNIGMDYWGASASAAIPVVHGKAPSSPVPGSRDGAQSQLWFQDEREVKRQRRKQSNRESARRSRLRKQAECDELSIRAESLREENATLRAEVNRIKHEYEQLFTENTLLKERVGESPGHENIRSDK